MSLPDFFETDRKEIERALDHLLPREDAAPELIHAAMRYSVFAGGKRIRPILCLETARIFDDRPEAAFFAGCAIEFIHTYSLIHDDLPALDDDDLRRGKPTCHKKYDEATAILAGDALLTLAFQVLAEVPVDPALRVQILHEVATAAGTVNGMVGGQVADLQAGGTEPSPAMLEYIHRSKTAALIRASVVAGALSGDAEEQDVVRLRHFGESIGWAFQVVDDILDVEESSSALGKTAGKDVAQKKVTYPAVYGLEKSREIAQSLGAQAMAALEPYGERGARLGQLAEFLIRRRS
jgi:geranylgeranyl diphosphate synthase type II